MSREAISISIPGDLLKIVDEFREKHYLKRSTAIARIILEWQAFTESGTDVPGFDLQTSVRATDDT